MLIIGGIIASFAVFNSVYPAVERSSQAVSSAADVVNDRITSRIQIIQADVNDTDIEVWIKNVGTSRIDGINGGDVFFGGDGAITRIPYGEDGASLPYWSYKLEGNNSLWSQSVTNKITIHLNETPSHGAYSFKLVIPNGMSDETSFGVE
jgi:hypothetical protein